MFGHDAHQGFRARFADQQPPTLRQIGFGLRDGGFDLRVFQRGLPGGEAHVFQQLRHRVELVEQFRGRFARADHLGQKLHPSHQPVARGRIVGHHDMARLLPPEVKASFAHPLHHIAVADSGPLQPHTTVVQETLQPQIAHHRGDKRLARKTLLLGPTRGHQRHELIAVADAAILINQDHPVSVAVKADAHVGAIGHHSLSRRLRLGGTAAVVDVEPVRVHAHGDHIRAQFPQRHRRHMVGRAMGAVDHHLEPIKTHLPRERGFDPFDIAKAAVVDPLGPANLIRRRWLDPLGDQRFDFLLDLIGEFEPIRAEELDAIVAGRVVTG